MKTIGLIISHNNGEKCRALLPNNIKKNVKKPSGGKPGFVVYYTNYSMMIGTDINGICECDS